MVPSAPTRSATGATSGTSCPAEFTNGCRDSPAEGVVGADAIFACLGPALEIFSRYSRVEKSDGSVVPLREYLEHVWAAVSKEALSMIFKDADASGLEPDARLTAMWLWTVRPDPSGTNSNGSPEEEADEDQEAEEEDPQDRPFAGGGYAIEFDAAAEDRPGVGGQSRRPEIGCRGKGQDSPPSSGF